MKISFFTNSMHRYPLEECFKKAKEFGYDAIELQGSRPHGDPNDITEEDIANIRRWSEEYGLPIISYEPEMPKLTWQKEEWNEEGVEHLKKCIDLCKALDIPKMVLAAEQSNYQMSTDEEWATFIRCAKKLAAYSEEIDGCILILETVTPWEGRVLLRADDIVRAMKEIDSPKVKGMLDLAAPLTVGEPSSQYFEKLGKDLIHIHLVDCNKDNEDHLIFGDGELPLEEVLTMIDSYGYDGYCSIELFDEYRTEPVLYNLKAIRVVRNACKELGIE